MIGNLTSLFGADGPSVSAQQALQRIQAGAIVVDVREPDEFAHGSIANAINVPLSTIDSLGPKALSAAGVSESSRDLLIICRSGARSASACARLRSVLGNRALNLQGGLMAWVGAGLPITRAR